MQPRPAPIAINRGKLALPRAASGTIVRARLVERLDAIWSVPLGLVVGPAGYGKSTLARVWAESRRSRIAWLTIDAADNDVDRFIAYLLATLSKVDERCVVNTRSLLDRASRPSVIELAEALADELIDLDDDLCAVLDEAELLQAPEVWEFLDCLLRLAPAPFHLLVVSRSEPPLPLSRMRMRQQLVELRAPELLFTQVEIETMLASAGVAMGESTAAAVRERTHGWPAGVRLAVLASGGMPGEPQELDPAAQAGFLLDPLTDEVLARLPESARDALLFASIVDDICLGLFRALVGDLPDTQAQWDELTRAGLFTTSAVRGGNWLRLHPLFQELFRRQIESRYSRAEVNRLRLAAAEWFENEGFVQEAVRHRLAARDLAGVIDLLNVEVPKAIDREDWSSVSEWLDSVPDDVISRSMPLALGRCWMLVLVGNVNALRIKRQEARDALANMDVTEAQRDAWLAELDVLEAALVPYRAEIGPELVDVMNRAVPRLDPQRRFVFGQGHQILADLLENLGRSAEADAVISNAIAQSGHRIDAGAVRALVARMSSLRQRGDLSGLHQAASELLVVVGEHDLPVTRGWARMAIALIAFERNDLATAEPLLTEIVDDQRNVHLVCLREAMLTLARTYWALGDRTESAAVIRRTHEILARKGAIDMMPIVTSQARMLQFLDDPGAAIDATGELEPISIAQTNLLFVHQPVTTAVLVNSASGTPERAEHALTLADAFLTRVRATFFPYWEPHGLALQAIALCACGKRAEAIRTMRAALSHRLAPSFVRSLMDLGPGAVELYRALESDHEVGVLAASLIGSAIPVAGGPEPERTESRRSKPQGSLLTQLTDRELKVLECLDRRLSYKEIGDELFISPLTVKRHAGNIYDKLGAGSRREAVAHARELGWQPGVVV